MNIRSSAKSVFNPNWKILIIDEEEDFLITRDMLRIARGHQIDVFWSATYVDGLAELFTSPYDAVLVEYDLGARSGTELIYEANERGVAAPLILFTGHGSYEIDLEAMRAGATLYLTKDEVNPLTLERFIRYAIEHKRVETETRLSEKSLSGSNTKIFQILENISDGFFSFDREWRMTYVNHRAAEQGGQKPEDLIGKVIWEASPMLAGTQLETVYRRVMQTRQFESTQFQNPISGRWFELRVHPWADGISVYSIDITEHKQAEQTVKKSDWQLKKHTRELEAILEAVPAYMWITHDAQARDMTGNRIVFDLMRMRPGDNLSRTTPQPEKVRHFRAMRDGVEIPDEKLPVQVVAATGVPLRDYEFDLVFEDGSVHHLLGNVSPLLDEEGKPAGAVSAFIDITARKKFQKQLQESENRFRIALASAPISVYTTDCELRVTWMYDPHPGFQQEFFLGIRMDEFIPGAIGTELVNIQRMVIDTGQAHKGEIESWVEGKLTHYAYYIDPIQDEVGDIIGLGCAGYDISNRKEAEKKLQRYAEELERSNQAFKDFAFIASHDLQEPLRKVVMFGKNLRRHLDEAQYQQADDALDRMMNAAERMQAMINGLLELSRINTRGGDFHSIDLNQVINEVVSDLEIRLQTVDGQILVGKLPTVVADEIQMRQLFQNLIVNAIKFHRPGTPPVVGITGIVRQDSESPVVEICVEDNGIGFEPENAGRIFQPFQRLHGRSEYEGTGLGLAICQKIIERHRGKITVQSEPGKGTKFSIALPIQNTPSPE